MNEQKDVFQCTICQSTFTSQKILDNHKKSAKYCLLLQGKENRDFLCNACGKSFTNNSRLGYHQSTCLDHLLEIKTADISKKCLFLEKENDELRSQIEKLQNILKELAERAISKPTTVNNTHNTHNTTNNTNNTNFISNLQIISEDHIISNAKHLTIDHIKKGAIGYSEYLLEYPLKDRIACTDYSRRKIKYKNEQGEVVTDPEMTKLSDLLFKSIKDRNRELTVQYSTELTEKFKTAQDPSQLSYFMELASKFSDQDMEVFKMFNGDKNEFFHDVIRNICSKTLIQ